MKKDNSKLVVYNWFDMRQHHVLESLIFAQNSSIQLTFVGQKFDIWNVNNMTFHVKYKNLILNENYFFALNDPTQTIFLGTSIWYLKCTLYGLSFDMRQPNHLRSLIFFSLNDLTLPTGKKKAFEILIFE